MADDARRLVGREAETAWLRRFLRDPGRGVAYVVGDPGIGKTALVSAVSGREPGRLTLVARCSELGSAPYGPLLDALHDALHDAAAAGCEPASGSGHLTALVKLEKLLSPRPGADDLTSRLDDAGQQLARASQALRDLGAARPCMLVVEDVQWADSATSRLIDYLSADAGRLTFPLIITSRSGKGVPSPLSSGLRQQLELRPLSETAVAELAARILGGPPSQSLVRDLRAWSGGNPFVLDALLFHARAAGLIERAAGGWDGSSLPVGTCPPELAAWLIGQHRGIEPETWELLQLAALIGDRVDAGLLRSAAGPGRDGDDLLERAEASGLLVADPGARALVFRHALVRAAIDSRISVVRRQRLHERIARALTARSPAALADRARHLSAAGLHDEAAPLQLAAAEAALRARSYAEARDLLANLLQHVRDAADRGIALCRLALALRQLSDPRGAVDAAEEGVRLLAAAGRAQDAARERLMLGFFRFETEGRGRSEQEWNRARDELSRFGDSEALALSHVWCGASQADEDPEGARSHVERGLEMAKRIGAAPVIAWAHHFLGVIETRLGDSAHGIDLIDLSYREGAELGSDLIAERALENACVTRITALRGREVEPMLAANRRVTDTGTWALFRDYGLFRALIELGELDRAVSLGRALRPGLSRLGAGTILEWLDGAYAALLADCGRTREALAVMPGSSDGLPAFNVMARAPAHIRFLLVTSDAPGAARVAAEALAAYEGRRLDFVVALRAAEGLFADGRADQLAGLRDTVDATPGLGGTAWADLIAGYALLSAGELDAARSSLAQAASRFAAASYQQHYARCLAMLAIASGGRGGSRGGGAGGGEGETGAALVGDALGILTGIGAHGTAAEISRLAASHGIVADPAAHSLSPRELQILRLLARGMTNADIAAALSISQHTVASHLDRIRDKTCRRRRAELTRFAMELGLVEGPG